MFSSRPSLFADHAARYGKCTLNLRFQYPRTRRLQHDVGALDVSMDQLLRVNVLHASGHSFRHTKQEASGRVALQRGRQIVAIAVLKQERVSGWLYDSAEDRDDVRVAKMRKRLDLDAPALKACDEKDTCCELEAIRRLEAKAPRIYDIPLT